MHSFPRRLPRLSPLLGQQSLSRPISTTLQTRYPANPNPSNPDHPASGLSDKANVGMDHQNSSSPNDAGTRNTGGRAGAPSGGGEGSEAPEAGMADPGIGGSAPTKGGAQGKGREDREREKAGGMGGESVAKQ